MSCSTRFVSLCVLLVAASACGVSSSLDLVGNGPTATGRTKTATLDIAFYQQPCWDDATGKGLCVVAREQGTAEDEVIPAPAGVSFVFGRTLTVEIPAREYEGDSGTYWKYGGVIRTVADNPVAPNTPFTVRFDRREYVIQDDPNNLKAWGAPTFTCDSDKQWLCGAGLQAKLHDLASDNLPFEAQFITQIADAPVLLVAVNTLPY